jgi:hypothetical protein
MPHLFLTSYQFKIFGQSATRSSSAPHCRSDCAAYWRWEALAYSCGNKRKGGRIFNTFEGMDSWCDAASKHREQRIVLSKLKQLGMQDRNTVHKSRLNDPNGKLQLFNDLAGCGKLLF